MNYSLGALKNTKDLRDVQLVQVQTPVSIPNKYITDISWIPVMNQKSLGACVGHAHALIHIYNEFKENNLKEKLSPRFLYALSKKIDGLKEQGTHPRTTASVMFNKGCPHEGFCLNNTSLSHEDYINIVESDEMLKDAAKYKIKGYAFVANNKDALKQAIFQNGLVAITISVGNFDNPIKPGNLGLHRVVVYGYDGDVFFYRNSWGEEWGDKGNGYFNWNEQQLSDIMTFVDLPNEVLKEAKNKYRYFSEKEIIGLKPELVKMLDDARHLAGIPFFIISGYRTAEHNAEVGGVENSAHTSGLAVDLRARNSLEHFKITKALFDVGFKRISRKYPGHIHCDIDESKPQNVLF